jgi:hypothetical protein
MGLHAIFVWRCSGSGAWPRFLKSWEFSVLGVNSVLYCAFQRFSWLSSGPGGLPDYALLSDFGSRHDFIHSTPQHQTINNKNQEKKITGVSLFVALWLRRVSMPETNTVPAQLT